MKIEVFSAKRREFTPLGTLVKVSWSWRSKVNGRITASAHGYSRRRDAVRAAVNHGYAFFKLPNTKFGNQIPRMAEKIDKAIIRAAIKVIE